MQWPEAPSFRLKSFWRHLRGSNPQSMRALTTWPVRRSSVMLTLFKARKIIDAALQRARELNVSVSVAICDVTGRLIALNQMDGSIDWEADRSSMGKAVAAAISGRPSERLVEHYRIDKLRSSSFHQVVLPRGQPGGL